jgi:hypothetical protein
MLAILRTYSEPRGVVFDFPSVVERARQFIQAAGLTERGLLCSIELPRAPTTGTEREAVS